MINIPIEILPNIFKYVPERTFQLNKVCKLFSKILNDRVCDDIVVIQNDSMLLVKYLKQIKKIPIKCNDYKCGNLCSPPFCAYKHGNKLFEISKIYSNDCLCIIFNYVNNYTGPKSKVGNFYSDNVYEREEIKFLQDLSFQFCVVKNPNINNFKMLFPHTLHKISKNSFAHNIMHRYIMKICAKSLVNKSYAIADYVLYKYIIFLNMLDEYSSDKYPVSILLFIDYIIYHLDEYINNMTHIFDYLLDNDILSSLQLNHHLTRIRHIRDVEMDKFGNIMDYAYEKLNDKNKKAFDDFFKVD